LSQKTPNQVTRGECYTVKGVGGGGGLMIGKGYSAKNEGWGGRIDTDESGVEEQKGVKMWGRDRNRLTLL